MTPAHEQLLREFKEFARTAPAAGPLMERICQRLHETMTRYNWVGFYLIDPADAGFLIVGPFVGSFTPNTRFPVDRGLCGAAATSGRTVFVEDVSKDPRYLAGSSMVKCEVVVPFFAKNRFAGELDVESYFLGTFTQGDREFVEACAAIVGGYLAKL